MCIIHFKNVQDLTYDSLKVQKQIMSRLSTSDGERVDVIRTEWLGFEYLDKQAIELNPLKLKIVARTE